MTYADWQADFAPVAAASSVSEAQAWNLENEFRIDTQRGQFRRRLGYLHDKARRTGLAGADAARSSLQQAISETDDVGSRWLGLLPVEATARLPERMYSHVPVSDFVRYAPPGHIDPANPVRRTRFGSAYKMTSRGPDRRFIWVTFESDGRAPSDDPTAVVQQLGLAHYHNTDYAYRFWLNVDGCELYIPTCLDAGLNEAWAPPPVGHVEPWGLTRDLETGDRCKPELLTETIDHAGVKPTVELVSPPGTSQEVGHIVKNFMVGR